MRRFALIALLLALASSAAAQGIFEYWKAGARTKHTTSTPLPGPQPRTVSGTPSSGSSRPAGPSAWTQAWFADRGSVAKQIAALRGAIAEPMIGERYPLPRGGGFRCTDFDASPHAPGDPEPWAMRCAGPDASCARENFFTCPAPGAAPTLAQVRWTARARDAATATSWRPYCRALADTLTRAWGSPAWIAADSTAVRWSREGFAVTLRLHGAAARPDSLEILARSSDLPADTRSSAAP